jgi:hypothetical protein
MNGSWEAYGKIGAPEIDLAKYQTRTEAASADRACGYYHKQRATSGRSQNHPVEPPSRRGQKRPSRQSEVVEARAVLKNCPALQFFLVLEIFRNRWRRCWLEEGISGSAPMDVIGRLELIWTALAAAVTVAYAALCAAYVGGWLP